MNGAGTEQEQTTAWSIWALRLVALLSLVLAASLIWLWIEVFYRSVSVNVQFSFKSFDVPTLAGDQVRGGPVIGHHYFGDFQVPWSYAWGLRQSISPYLRGAPEQYPPFSQVLFLPFTFLSVRAAALTYLGLSAAVFLVPLWLLLAPMRTTYRIVFLVPVAILTTPFIAIVDRGNNIGIAVGLVAWSLWACRKERWILCAIFLAGAIALKAYPVALLIVPLAYRRYKFAGIVAASAASANLLLLAFYPGGFLRNLREVLPALKGGYDPSAQLASWSAYSLVPKTAGVLFGSSAIGSLLAPNNAIIWLPSLFYIGAIYVVIRCGRVPQWCWGPLALASMQVLVPVSFVYTTAWAAVAAVWYAQGSLIDIDASRSTPTDDSGYVALRVMVLLALVATLAPSVFTMTGSGGFELPITRYASPLLIFLTACVALWYSLRPVEAEALADPS